MSFQSRYLISFLVFFALAIEAKDFNIELKGVDSSSAVIADALHQRSLKWFSPRGFGLAGPLENPGVLCGAVSLLNATAISGGNFRKLFDLIFPTQIAKNEDFERKVIPLAEAAGMTDEGITAENLLLTWQKIQSTYAIPAGIRLHSLSVKDLKRPLDMNERGGFSNYVNTLIQKSFDNGFSPVVIFVSYRVDSKMDGNNRELVYRPNGGHFVTLSKVQSSNFDNASFLIEFVDPAQAQVFRALVFEEIKRPIYAFDNEGNWLNKVRVKGALNDSGTVNSPYLRVEIPATVMNDTNVPPDVRVYTLFDSIIGAF